MVALREWSLFTTGQGDIEFECKQLEEDMVCNIRGWGMF